MSGEQGEPKVYSVIELDNAVAAGSITQQQRDQIFAKQVNDEAIRNATAVAVDVVETQTRDNELDSELKQYASLVPDVMNDNSPTRQRIGHEFEYLVSKGAPRNLSTELAAVRAVMGSLDRIRAHQSGRRVAPTPFGDTTGGSRMSPQERREADAFDRLSPKQRDYYQTMINKGVYANRSAVLSELNWRRGSNTNQRGRA